MNIIKGKLQRFNRDTGWFFIPVPTAVSRTYQIHADRGLITITARIGSNSWHTSMLPYGDGIHFIPIPLKIRVKNDYEIGDVIRVEYELR